MRITNKQVIGVFERFCKAVPAPEGMRWVLQEKDIIPWSLGAVEIATYPNGVWSQPFGHLAWDKNADAWEALRCMAFVGEYLLKHPQVTALLPFVAKLAGMSVPEDYSPLDEGEEPSTSWDDQRIDYQLTRDAREAIAPFSNEPEVKKVLAEVKARQF